MKCFYIGMVKTKGGYEMLATIVRWKAGKSAKGADFEKNHRSSVCEFLNLQNLNLQFLDILLTVFSSVCF